MRETFPSPCSEGSANELEVVCKPQVVGSEREVVLARAAPEAHHRYSEALPLVPVEAKHSADEAAETPFLRRLFTT